MTTHSAYDAFAATYNRHWGNEFAPRVFPILEQLVLRKLRSGARILDLCCGTGQFAGTLTGLGYRVTGIDGSAEMLRYARENAPEAEFVHADARSFRLPEKYAAVISVFDSLNHVLTIEELTDVFARVHAALAPGGFFFFDLNMAAAYFLTWNDNFGIVEDDLVCIVRTAWDGENRTARFDATIFNMPDGWQRVDLTIHQKCYAAEEVVAALESAGFTGIECYGHEDGEGLTPIDEATARGFFLCRRSGSRRRS